MLELNIQACDFASSVFIYLFKVRKYNLVHANCHNDTSLGVGGSQLLINVQERSKMC